MTESRENSDQTEQPYASDDEILRHAEKQGVSWSDAWRYFEREGYDMSGVVSQYGGPSGEEIMSGSSWMQEQGHDPADIEDTDSRWKQAADQALADGGPVHPTPEGSFRGASADLVILDEDAYLRDRELSAAALRGLARGGIVTAAERGLPITFYRGFEGGGNIKPPDQRIIGVDMTARGSDPITFYYSKDGKLAPVKMPEPGEKVRIITGKPTGPLDEETGLRAYQAGDQVQISEPIEVVNRVSDRTLAEEVEAQAGPLKVSLGARESFTEAVSQLTTTTSVSGLHPETRKWLLARMLVDPLGEPVFFATAGATVYPEPYMPSRRLVDPAWDIEDTHPFHD